MIERAALPAAQVRRRPGFRGVLRTVLVAGLAATLAAGAACSAPGGGAADEPPLRRAAGVQRATVGDAGSAVAAVAGGMTGFACDLYRAGATPSQNAVFSPLSIEVAFATTRAGARGRTAAEIDKVLHFPGRDLHEAFNAITRQVVTTDGPPPPRKATRKAEQVEPPVVSLANGLFAQRGFAIREAFLRTLASQYGTGVGTVDFTAGGEAARQIDAWVRRQTAGRIDKLFGQLDPSTRLVLANALYLRADWEQPFTESSTTDATFTRADGSTVQARMMQRAGQLGYAAGDGWQAVELPYAGGQLAMRVLLPTGRLTPADLLTPGTLAAVAARLRPEVVAVSLPRWKASSQLDLSTLLRRLGLVAPFGAADFSGIAAEPLYIQQAVHRATITVDEWGTEAAAVTGLAFAVSGVAPPELTFRADRPFAFVIVHKATGVPLFVGQVADPTVES
jgi:serpin B